MRRIAAGSIAFHAASGGSIRPVALRRQALRLLDRTRRRILQLIKRTGKP